MKQNIYDDPRFFEGYRRLRDSDSGLNGTVEDPAFLSVLPSLQGRAVLDLGSGFGDFCRFAKSQGASLVRGVEISRRMTETAKKRTEDPTIEYVNVAVEDFTILPTEYDLVVSRLALHYVENYQAVVHSVYAGLREGGVFAFSVEHPMCTALSDGWYKTDEGEKLHWPVDNYSAEGKRKLSWFVDGVIKYHRTLQTYINTLLDCGFIITRFLEPHADARDVKVRPELRDTRRRPPFLIVAAVKGPKPTPGPTDQSPP